MLFAICNPGLGVYKIQMNNLCKFSVPRRGVEKQKTKNRRTETQTFSACWAFVFVFSEKKSVNRDSNSRPNVSEGYEATSELPGRPYNRGFVFAAPNRGMLRRSRCALIFL